MSDVDTYSFEYNGEEVSATLSNPKNYHFDKYVELFDYQALQQKVKDLEVEVSCLQDEVCDFESQLDSANREIEGLEEDRDYPEREK